MILYHADRENLLSEGITLTLENNYHLAQKDLHVIYDLYPDGLSRHGVHYFDDCIRDIRSYWLPNGNNRIEIILPDDFSAAKRDLDNSFCEYNFELVRRALFPKVPSRMQCLFAVASIEEFVQWQDCNFPPDCHVYEISVSDSTQRFDSKWLRGGYVLNQGSIGGSYLGFSPVLNLNSAVKYWSGMQTDSPRWEYLVSFPVTVGKRVR
ncbi:MAG: hypothetical protein DBX91_14205 [Subdoligranulum variabile]|uniref:DUF2441 domain-containing protein n=1 Tax=uncultured Subdoligranulum sp. TaxID=512298 RepID=UPI000D7AF43F|nr:DUF2441 domain-containing protein [uncultured Subdoligranulum sp.]PWM56319.1 MAG: hypothetical protein DBX91_14205 [Subdoligranulum variabile]